VHQQSVASRLFEVWTGSLIVELCGCCRFGSNGLLYQLGLSADPEKLPVLLILISLQYMRFVHLFVYGTRGASKGDAAPGLLVRPPR
jgi:hypothetical protein